MRKVTTLLSFHCVTHSLTHTRTHTHTHNNVLFARCKFCMNNPPFGIVTKVIAGFYSC